MTKLFSSYIESKRKAAWSRLEEWQGLLYSGVVLAATLIVMFWASVFLYTSFYFTYMPQESVTWPIHFQYKSCGEVPGICSNPHAAVSVTDPIRGPMLARGQKYRVVVDIEMPESPTNQRLGMFLVDVSMKSHNGDLLRQSSRSTMLRYRSPLLQTLATAIFSPFLLYGVNEEKQMVTVELFSQYEEDPTTALSEVHVELMTRHVELYGAQLRIHAVFTGLRYFMYHYPLTAASVGIGICMVFLSAVVILSWYQFSGTSATSQLVRKPTTFPNGQAIVGTPANMKTNTPEPSQNVVQRCSSTKKELEMDTGKDVSNLSSSDFDKSDDSNQLPEAERRDSDEFEVVSSTKGDVVSSTKEDVVSSPKVDGKELSGHTKRSIGADEDSGQVRQRVQTIPTEVFDE